METYGSEKTVQIPFVMGVMADLTGKADPPEEVPAGPTRPLVANLTAASSSKLMWTILTTA